MANMKVRITGSPLKTVTGQCIRDLRLGDVYVHAKGGVLMQIVRFEPFAPVADAFTVSFRDGLGGETTLNMRGSDVVATRRSITAEEAGTFFNGVPSDGDLSKMYAHLG